jgi:RNA recognition motif-containing protein
MAFALFVEPLPASMSESHLKQVFEPLGRVVWATIPADHRGVFLGYGYVEMESQIESDIAVKELDGYEIDSCRLQVSPLSFSPLITEARRFLNANYGKQFCDVCLLSHLNRPPAISLSHALGMLIRHFQTSTHGTCFDCGRHTQVIAAKAASEKSDGAQGTAGQALSPSS